MKDFTQHRVPKSKLRHTCVIYFHAGLNVQYTLIIKYAGLANYYKTVFIPISRSTCEFLPLQLDSNVQFVLAIALVTYLWAKTIIIFSLKTRKISWTFHPSWYVGNVCSCFRIDWCNSLFFGLSDTTVSKIQTQHNACAKYLTGGKRFDSATEKLKELHWHPVKYRIKYKNVNKRS